MCAYIFIHLAYLLKNKQTKTKTKTNQTNKQNQKKKTTPEKNYATESFPSVQLYLSYKELQRS